MGGRGSVASLVWFPVVGRAREGRRMKKERRNALVPLLGRTRQQALSTSLYNRTDAPRRFISGGGKETKGERRGFVHILETAVKLNVRCLFWYCRPLAVWSLNFPPLTTVVFDGVRNNTLSCWPVSLVRAAVWSVGLSVGLLLGFVGLPRQFTRFIGQRVAKQGW